MTVDVAEIKTGLSDAATELGSVFSGFGKHLKQSANAHYHLMGQFTLPLSKNPPKPKDVSIPGQVILFPIPIVANLLAITVIPLIGNSIKSLGHAYVRTTNLALLDVQDRQINTTPDTRGADENGNARPALWILQNAYGLPGAILGGVLGLASAAIITLTRIIMSSFVSGARAFLSAANLFSDTDEEDLRFTGLKAEALHDRNQRRSYYDMFVLGAPGVAVGGALGLISGALFFSIKHSAITAKRTIASMVKLSLYKSGWQQNWNPETLHANDWKNSVVGFPGFIIGATIGAIASSFVLLARFTSTIWPMIKNSFITSGLTIKTMTLAALADSKKWAPKTINAFSEDQRQTNEKVLGSPGFLLGSIIGAVSMSAVLAWRFIVNNVQTAWQMMVSMTNVVLPPKARQPWKKTGIFNQTEAFERHKYWRYGIASPGLLIGAVLGVIPAFFVSFGRVFYHSALTAGRTVTAMVKGALYDSHRYNINAIKPFEHQTKEDNIYGFPGYVFGSLIGAVTFSVISVWRVITNNVQSGWQMAKFIGNSALPKSRRSDILNTGIVNQDEGKFSRPKYWRYGIGAPGIVIGAVLGSIAAVFITFGRTFKHSSNTSGRMIKTMLHGALYDTKNKKIQNWLARKEGISQNPVEDSIWGAPGFLIGGIIGAISVAAVSVWRFMINTVQTAWQMIVSMTNAVLPKPPGKDWKEVGIANPDEMLKRPKYWRYGIASPGLLIGAAVGLIPAFFVCVGRVIQHSALTTARMVVAMVKGALYDSHRHNINAAKPFTKQNKEDSIYGAPGFVFGALIGAVTFSAIAALRFIVNNVQTAWQMISSMTNAVLPKSKRGKRTDVGIFKKEQQPFSRENYWRYGIASPGLLIGAVLGSISAFFVGFGRFVYYSAVNTKRMATLMIKGALFDSHKYKGSQAKDIRDNTTEETLLGLPGIAIGTIVGAISYVSVMVWRFVINNVQSAWQMTATMINAVLPSSKRKDNDKVGLFNKNEKFSRENYWRYGLALPGIAIGTIMGAVAAIAVGFTGFIVHGFKSWQALSGSMMNGALNRKRFAGLGGDDRKNHEKALGALGYVFALLTLPVAILVGVVRKIPYIALMTLSVVLSPFTALLRVLIKRNKHRFQNAHEEDPVENAFKNLNSALNGWGKFVQGAKILDHQKGNKGPANTVRKVMFFNYKSSTEQVLDKILAKIRAIPKTTLDVAAFFNSTEFTDAFKDIKEKTKSNILLNDEERATKLAQIDSVADFVKDYVLDYVDNKTSNHIKQVPTDFYRKHQKYSWKATLWGGKPKHDATSQTQPVSERAFAM